MLCRGVDSRFLGSLDLAALLEAEEVTRARTSMWIACDLWVQGRGGTGCGLILDFVSLFLISARFMFVFFCVLALRSSANSYQSRIIGYLNANDCTGKTKKRKA